MSGSGSSQAANEDQSLATVRPQPSKLPNSLRHLFDSDIASVPDPFRIPGFNSSNKEATSATPNSQLPPPSPVVPPPPLPPSVPRDRTARRALRIDSSFEDGPNLSTATFAFPPRTISRGTKSKGISGPPPSEGQGNSLHPGHVERPSTAPASPSSETMTFRNGTSTSTTVPKFVGRRDPRLDTSEPGQESIFHRPGHETILPVISKDDGPLADARSAATSRRNPASQKRSQSTTRGPPLRPSLEQNSPLPPEFQFPGHISSSDHEHSSFSSSVLRARARESPTRAGASETPLSLHSSTHSLDAQIPASLPRRPSPPGLAPPVLGRSRSATPADDRTPDAHTGPLTGGHRPQRRPSLHRLASETAPQTKTPSKPVRGRSGNSAGGVGDLSGIPGLKDVLKVIFTLASSCADNHPIPGSCADLGAPTWDD